MHKARIPSMRPSPFLKNRQSDELNIETWLLNEDPAKQELAKVTLARLDHDHRLMYLLSLASREEKAIGKRAGLHIVLVITLLLLVTVFIQEASRHHTSFPLPLYFMMNPMIAYLKRPTKLHRCVNNLLAEESDVSLTPVILNAWMHGGYLDFNVPAKCLARLLPQISNADAAAILDKTQWEFLTSWLSPRRTRAMRLEVRHDFLRAILLACGNLNKSDALPRVKRLAEAKTNDADVQQLQQTARNYVTLLENQSNMLQTIARH